MMNVELEEMSFEMSRCKPQLTEAFFAELDRQVDEIKWSTIGRTEYQEKRMQSLEAMKKVGRQP